MEDIYIRDIQKPIHSMRVGIKINIKKASIPLFSIKIDLERFFFAQVNSIKNASIMWRIGT